VGHPPLPHSERERAQRRSSPARPPWTKLGSPRAGSCRSCSPDRTSMSARPRRASFPAVSGSELGRRARSPVGRPSKQSRSPARYGIGLAIRKSRPPCRSYSRRTRSIRGRPLARFGRSSRRRKRSRRVRDWSRARHERPAVVAGGWPGSTLGCAWTRCSNRFSPAGTALSVAKISPRPVSVQYGRLACPRSGRECDPHLQVFRPLSSVGRALPW
jgi:hypothetical protein